MFKIFRPENVMFISCIRHAKTFLLTVNVMFYPENVMINVE